jgi:hypothetical protein
MKPRVRLLTGPTISGKGQACAAVVLGSEVCVGRGRRVARARLRLTHPVGCGDGSRPRGWRDEGREMCVKRPCVFPTMI